MMIVEGLIGGVVALGGYAWFERDQRKSKLEDAERQKQLDEALQKAATEFVEQLIMASALQILGYPEVAAQWRKTASDRLRLIHAGEACKALRSTFSKEFVLRVGELLGRADIAEETRTEAANLLRQLTREVQSNPVSSPRGYTAGRRGNLMWSPT
jgi:hypothetical protein